MALVYQETRAEAVCSLEQDVLVLLNDKSRMKGDLHVRFREKFEVKVLLLTRLRGRELIAPSYSNPNRAEKSQFKQFLFFSKMKSNM